MTEQAPAPRERVQHSNSYNIFILVLTILSLAIMALLLLPLPEQVLQVLWVYDNLICFVFLGRFHPQHAAYEAEPRLLHRAAGLARPDGFDPELEHPQDHRPPPSCASQPAGADFEAPARGEQEAPHRGRPSRTAANTRRSSRCCRR